MSDVKALTVDEVIEKVNKGEELSSAEETTLLKSEGAPEDYANAGIEGEGISKIKEPEKKEVIAPDVTADDRTKYEGKSDDEIVELKQAEVKKDETAAAEKEKDQAAIIERAKKAGLKEDAKVEEIEAKEKEIQAKEEDNDFFTRAEREITKPDGQEDLKDFSKREKAFFYQMRRDRRSRQTAEEERDVALLDKIKRDKATKDEKEEKPDALADLKKKDGSDFIKVEDVVKLIEDIQKAPPKTEEKDPAPHAVQGAYIKMSDDAARAAKDDYDVVMELMPEIIDVDPEKVKKVAFAMASGQNPALVAYDIIKGDPEFAKLLPVAEVRAKAKVKKPVKTEEKPVKKTDEEIKKETDAAAAQKLLEANKNKTKTTSHVVTEDKPAGEKTLEEITSMSDREFSLLPKATRQKYLELYG